MFIHTASKYDESQLLHVPRAVFRYVMVGRCVGFGAADLSAICDVSRANLKWVCPDNPNAHHSVMPCAPDKVPALEDNQVCSSCLQLPQFVSLSLFSPSVQVHDSFARFRSQCLSLQLSLDVGPRGEEVCLLSSCLRYKLFSSLLPTPPVGHPTHSSPVCQHFTMAAAISECPLPCHLSAHSPWNCACQCAAKAAAVQQAP